GAMVLTGIAGILIGSPVLRLRGDYLAIMTIAFGQIVQAIILNASDLTNGSQGLYGIPTIMTFPIAFWTTVIIVTIIFLFMNSRHGRAILSIREDEIAAESVGINVSKYKLLGFVIASMFAAVGGSVFAFSIGFIAPTSFDFMASIEIFVIVVLGGMGSITGSIIASILIVLLPEYLRAFDDYRYLIYSVSLILMMSFRPQGLLGTKEFNIRKLFHINLKSKLVKGSDS
ncbi:MAG: branched-chain amino acid ABC transporter permease, partial [Sphaerochaetaceae bacterium]|nr:branched-chain amino acid ABC transporter permease [Sphaerochaetaceae bacterium]